MKNRRKKQKINSKTVDLHRTISIITFEVKGPDTLHYKADRIKTKSILSSVHCLQGMSIKHEDRDRLKIKVGERCAGSLCPGGSPPPFLPLRSRVSPSSLPSQVKTGLSLGWRDCSMEGTGKRRSRDIFLQEASGGKDGECVHTNKFCPSFGLYLKHRFISGVLEGYNILSH